MKQSIRPFNNNCNYSRQTLTKPRRHIVIIPYNHLIIDLVLLRLFCKNSANKNFYIMATDHFPFCKIKKLNVFLNCYQYILFVNISCKFINTIKYATCSYTVLCDCPCVITAQSHVLSFDRMYISNRVTHFCLVKWK